MIWVLVPGSVAMCGLALFGGSGGIIAVIAVTVSLVAITCISMRALVEVDSSQRVRVRYLIYCFSEKLENMQIEVTSKFDFRRDEELGFKALYEGTRLPCFNVGWFVLNNDSVAFVCLTRKRRARAFKTHDGCYLVLDPHIARRIEAVAHATNIRAPWVEQGKSSCVN